MTDYRNAAITMTDEDLTIFVRRPLAIRMLADEMRESLPVPTNYRDAYGNRIFPVRGRDSRYLGEIAERTDLDNSRFWQFRDCYGRIKAHYRRMDAGEAIRRVRNSFSR